MTSSTWMNNGRKFAWKAAHIQELYLQYLNFCGHIRKTNSPGKMVLKHWGPRNHLIHKNKHFSFILLGIFLKIITFVIKNTHLQIVCYWKQINVHKKQKSMSCFFYLTSGRCCPLLIQACFGLVPSLKIFPSLLCTYGIPSHVTNFWPMWCKCKFMSGFLWKVF